MLFRKQRHTQAHKEQRVALTRGRPALLAVLARLAILALFAVPALLAVLALLAILALLAAGALPASPTLLTAGAPPTVLAPLHPRSARSQRLAPGATERLKQGLKLRF